MCLLYSEGQRRNLVPSLILANPKVFGMKSGGPKSQSPLSSLCGPWQSSEDVIIPQKLNVWIELMSQTKL